METVFRVRTREVHSRCCSRRNDNLNVNTQLEKKKAFQAKPARKKTHFLLYYYYYFFLPNKIRDRAHGNAGYESEGTRETAEGTCCEQVNARGRFDPVAARVWRGVKEIWEGRAHQE